MFTGKQKPRETVPQRVIRGVAESQSTTGSSFHSLSGHYGADEVKRMIANGSLVANPSYPGMYMTPGNKKHFVAS